MILILLGALTPLWASEWEDTDTALATWTAVALIADRNQTRKIVDHGRVEGNRWMGPAPDDDRVDKHFVATSIVVGLISYALPQKTRRLFLTAFNVAETVTVMHNYRLGLGINF